MAILPLRVSREHCEWRALLGLMISTKPPTPLYGATVAGTLHCTRLVTTTKHVQSDQQSPWKCITKILFLELDYISLLLWYFEDTVVLAWRYRDGWHSDTIEQPSTMTPTDNRVADILLVGLSSRVRCLTGFLLMLELVENAFIKSNFQNTNFQAIVAF